LHFHRTTGVYFYERDEVAISTLAAGAPGNDNFVITVDDGTTTGPTSTSDRRDLVFLIHGAQDELVALFSDVTASVNAGNMYQSGSDAPGATLRFGDLDGPTENSDIRFRIYFNPFASEDDLPDDLIPASTATTLAPTAQDIASGSDTAVALGTLGTVTITELDIARGTMKFSYTANTSSTPNPSRNLPDIASLGEGQSLVERVTIYAYIDGDISTAVGASQVFTINGVNDAPVVTFQETADAGVDGVVEHNPTAHNENTVSGTVTITDTDGGQGANNATVRYSFDESGNPGDPTTSSTLIAVGTSSRDLVTKYGHFNLTRLASGQLTWTYTLNDNDADTNALTQGQVVMDRIKIKAWDNSATPGASDPVTIAVKVTGGNARPVMDRTEYSGEIIENAGRHTVVSGITFNASDDDGTRFNADDFDITGTGSNLFEVVATGSNFGLRLKTAGTLNWDTGTREYNLKITADDGANITTGPAGSHSVSEEADVTVRVRNHDEGDAAFQVTGLVNGAIHRNTTLGVRKTSDDPDGSTTGHAAGQEGDIYSYEWRNSGPGSQFNAPFDDLITDNHEWRIGTFSPSGFLRLIVKYDEDGFEERITIDVGVLPAAPPVSNPDPRDPIQHPLEYAVDVKEGETLIDLSDLRLTDPVISGDDDEDDGFVQTRQTQDGVVVEFISAPDYEKPEDHDGDNVYEFTILDNGIYFDVDVTIVDI
jgi:VCBS repeat-containing protein